MKQIKMYNNFGIIFAGKHRKINLPSDAEISDTRVTQAGVLEIIYNSSQDKDYNEFNVYIFDEKDLKDRQLMDGRELFEKKVYFDNRDYYIDVTRL